jgi:hypothetical protein
MNGSDVGSRPEEAGGRLHPGQECRRFRRSFLVNAAATSLTLSGSGYPGPEAPSGCDNAMGQTAPTGADRTVGTTGGGGRGHTGLKLSGQAPTSKLEKSPIKTLPCLLRRPTTLSPAGRRSQNPSCRPEQRSSGPSSRSPPSRQALGRAVPPRTRFLARPEDDPVAAIEAIDAVDFHLFSPAREAKRSFDNGEARVQAALRGTYSEPGAIVRRSGRQVAYRKGRAPPLEKEQRGAG